MKRTRSAASLALWAAVIALSLAAAPRAVAASHTLQTRLCPTGATPSAWGTVSYKSVRAQRRLTVQTHGLDPGTYDVLVGGGPVGSMDILEGVSSGEGSGRFVLDSRAAGLLIFDPRGNSVEVVNQATGMIELEVDEFPSNKREEMERTRVVTAFRNTSVQPAASGEAEFRSFKGRSRFVVKMAGLEPGIYDVLVGGSSQAQLEILSLDEVELTFDTMPLEGDVEASYDSQRAAELDAAADLHRLLTFDPRGFAVSISKDGADLLAIDLLPY